MASKHLVDSELWPLLEFFPALELSRAALPGIREMIAARPVLEPTGVELMVTVREFTAPGPANSAPVRLLCYRPNASAAAKLPAVLHIHGGGYVLGSPDMMDLSNRRLAAEVNCAVFSVDYRLAPETPHPGPVEDCYAALKWLHGNASTLQIDAHRIAVKGESAGGGLAAALALLARDRGEVFLKHQNLIYPMIDDRTGADGSDPHPFVGEYIWTPADNRFGWSSLLGTAPGGPEVSPYAAAARAADLAGLPPAFISVGALDLFLEEDLAYARRLAKAGVPIELHVYPGAFHAFDVAPQSARVAVAAARDSREALRRALHG
jgi:acetyl esterase/lipase